jgi:hypothetical protein
VRSFFDNGFNSDAQVRATLTLGKQVFLARTDGHPFGTGQSAAANGVPGTFS